MPGFSFPKFASAASLFCRFVFNFDIFFDLQSSCAQQCFVDFFIADINCKPCFLRSPRRKAPGQIFWPKGVAFVRRLRDSHTMRSARFVSHISAQNLEPLTRRARACRRAPTERIRRKIRFSRNDVVTANAAGGFASQRGGGRRKPCVSIRVQSSTTHVIVRASTKRPERAQKRDQTGPKGTAPNSKNS